MSAGLGCLGLGGWHNLPADLVTLLDLQAATATLDCQGCKLYELRSRLQEATGRHLTVHT